MEKLLGFPFLASESGAEIDHSIVNIHWLMLALFVGWGLFFIYTLIRFRRKAHPAADPVGIRGRWPYYLVYLVAAIEAVELIGFSIPLLAKRAHQFPDEKDAVVVRVVAEQFNWNIHYPGPDGVFGKTAATLITPDNPLGIDRTDPHAKDDITTINQMNVPVDKPVIVHLTSKDVIHSFNLVTMRVKQDAIPGMNVPFWFVPTTVGNYEIACAQLCGLGHYRMRGYINVQTPEEYAKWQAEQAAALAPPAN